MFTFWSLVLSVANGFIKLVSDIMNKMKEDQLIQQGREKQAQEITEKQAEILKQQAEILAQNQTTDKTIDKLNDGKF